MSGNVFLYVCERKYEHVLRELTLFFLIFFIRMMDIMSYLEENWFIFIERSKEELENICLFFYKDEWMKRVYFSLE